MGEGKKGGRYVGEIEAWIVKAIDELDQHMRVAVALGQPRHRERLKNLRAELERVRRLADDEYRDR